MDGIPLAFCINPGNTAETTTLKPLEDNAPEIISTLQDMNFLSIPGEGYIPTYTRTIQSWKL